MTEKRFRLGYVCGDYGLIDNNEWIDLHSMSENSEKNVQICINKMNELSDENEQLKQNCKNYVWYKEYKRLLNENEELKNDNHNLSQKMIKSLDRHILLEKENEQLKQQLQKIQDSFEFKCTQNYVEFDKDKLYIKDNNTEIRLDGTNLFIEVYIPQIDEYYRFKYIVTGRSLMKGFIKKYNLNGDVE